MADRAPAATSWLLYDASTRGVTLRLIGACNNTVYEYDFDGYV